MRIHRRRRATRHTAAMTLCPPGSGGVGPSASWPLLADGSASPRRGALHTAPRRPERGRCYFPDRLLAAPAGCGKIVGHDHDGPGIAPRVASAGDASALAAASELPAVLHRPAGVAHRHLDAVGGAVLAGLQDDRLGAPARDDR